jgi:hypothetical protein
MTHLSMHSVTNHPACPVIAFTLSTQRDGLPESTLMGSPGVSGLDFTTNELARRNTRPKRVRHYPTDCMFASGCSPPRLTATQLPSATGSGHLPEGTFTPKARLLGGALIPARFKPESSSDFISKVRLLTRDTEHEEAKMPVTKITRRLTSHCSLLTVHCSLFLVIGSR